MLSGLEIKRQIGLGNIVIEPFNEKQMNPNSYNIKLGKHLKVYEKALVTVDEIEKEIAQLMKPYTKEYYEICMNMKNEGSLTEEACKERDKKIDEIAEKRAEFSEQVLRKYALDYKQANETIDIEIPEEGYVLRPGLLYLGETEEYTETYGLIPNIDGRSTMGRLGIEIHRTAGFGDNGFKGKWTLEITVTHPVIVYPGMEIGQIYYETIDGDSSMTYNGKYQNQEGVVAAKVDKE